jgi:hypothetical protein
MVFGISSGLLLASARLWVLVLIETVLLGVIMASLIGFVSQADGWWCLAISMVLVGAELHKRRRETTRGQ